MQTSSMKISPFELMSAILTGKSNIPSDSGVAIFIENRELLMILTTAVAALIGFFVFIWRRSNGQKSSKAAEAPKPLIVRDQAPEPEVDDGKKKVTIFFGTQTGTAEGFAKALAEEARARYEKATFRIADLDDYGADDDEYEEKMKKETIAFFFLATYGDGEPTDNAPTELKIKGNKCFSHLSTIDTDEDLSKTWRLMTKVKDALEYGRRLENLSWRLWFMHHLIIHDQKRSKKYFRKLSTATTKKLETEKSTALNLLDTPDFKSKPADSSFLERKGKKKARKHVSSAAQHLNTKKPKYALKQCSMPTSEAFVKTDTSQMDIDEKGPMSIQIPVSDSNESMTMSPTHSDMVMIQQQGSPESTSTISTSDDSNDMQLTEPVGSINDIYTVFNEDFLRGSFTDEHAFVLHRFTTDQEETQSVLLQDSYVGYGSDFHSDVPSIGVSLNQLLRSVYANYSSDSSEPTSPTEMDLINSQGYSTPGLQYHHPHLTEQMVASSSSMSNAVYVPRSASTPTVDTDLANNLISVLGTPMNTPVTDIPAQSILGSSMLYVNQYQSDQSTVQPISISQRQTNSTGNQSSARQSSENRVKKAHSSGEQQCFNCGVTSTPLWRRSANDELLCNACGLYLKLHKMDRPKTMKPHIVRKDARDDEASQPVCTNCSTMTTPLWRRDEEGQTLCNACGLYFKLHHEKRPLSMKTDVIKKRQRYENGQNPNRRTAKKHRDSIPNQTQQVSPPQSTSPTEAQTQTIYPSIGVTASPNPPSARTPTSSMSVSSNVSPISATSI